MQSKDEILLIDIFWILGAVIFGFTAQANGIPAYYSQAHKTSALQNFIA
jgi:hypothetical protein